MRTFLIQTDITWENKSRNFRKYERMIAHLEKPDIIILPEMFTTGFTSGSETLSEPARGETFDWMMHISGKTGSGICGSYMVRERNRYFNRWVFVSPDGNSWHYDKRHLFKMNDVENNFTQGKKRLVFRFRGFRICPNICYDLRFPVWSRNRNDYDLLINSADWPAARRDVWITLLRARAIENLCYVAGSNRIGTDGAGIKYSGESMIFGPKGETVAGGGKNLECVVAADLSISALKAFRMKFPAHLDSDKFKIEF